MNVASLAAPCECTTFEVRTARGTAIFGRCISIVVVGRGVYHKISVVQQVGPVVLFVPSMRSPIFGAYGNLGTRGSLYIAFGCFPVIAVGRMSVSWQMK